MKDYKNLCVNCVCLVEEDGEWFCDELAEYCVDLDACPEDTIKGMASWEVVAKHGIEDYGWLVDWDERFFVCCECDEPIYECDYAMIPYGEDEDGRFYICPVCENRI